MVVPKSAIWNWEELDACFRGPDHAGAQATIRGLITNLAPGPSEVLMDTSPTYPNDSGYVSAAGMLRLRLITFTFPATWGAIREPYGRIDKVAIVTLGPMALPACNWARCGTWPAMSLAPNAIAVSAWIDNRADLTLAGAPGDPILVAGGPATLATSKADADCAAIGGQESLQAFVPGHPAGGSLYVLDACIRGPHLASNEALFRGILTSGVPSPHYEG